MGGWLWVDKLAFIVVDAFEPAERLVTLAVLGLYGNQIDAAIAAPGRASGFLTSVVRPTVRDARSLANAHKE